MEMRYYRKILRISYKDHVSSEEACDKIQQAIGPHDDHPTIVNSKLKWYEHLSRSSGLAKTILQGTASERVKKTRQTEKEVGRQH